MRVFLDIFARAARSRLFTRPRRTTSVAGCPSRKPFNSHSSLGLWGQTAFGPGQRTYFVQALYRGIQAALMRAFAVSLPAKGRRKGSSRRRGDAPHAPSTLSVRRGHRLGRIGARARLRVTFGQPWPWRSAIFTLTRTAPLTGSTRYRLDRPLPLNHVAFVQLRAGRGRAICLPAAKRKKSATPRALPGEKKFLRGNVLSLWRTVTEWQGTKRRPFTKSPNQKQQH